ncbi:hypothetical protein NONI108955_36145 [Nocardia ninae]|uniref:Uncharacterized protein n=1 Tax=Nocardia ninae NBRC 108245 TaxID=1210091 RepID=A0A511MN24_9NOCA|nr:hypothetical protein [Nocardia ninae]GEM41527.1 hypothetical protein NN4_60460 [Nocardia ninae NBRC 108245]
MTTPIMGELRNVKYVAASPFQPVESAARMSFLVGGTEIRLSLEDARLLTQVVPNVLAEHSVSLSFEPLRGWV